MADPTAKLLDRMKARQGWDSVIDDVPIFREHSLYEVGKGEKAYKVAVLPGDKPPHGARLLYSIKRRDLEDIAEKINRNLERHGKAIKLFVGHTEDPSRVGQKGQPSLVGYAGKATVGKWGPEGALGVLTPWYIERGCKSQVKELPERSPEYYPSTNELTSIALLKTDPKLPMGMLTYQHATFIGSDGAVHYGREFSEAIHMATMNGTATTVATLKTAHTKRVLYDAVAGKNVTILYDDRGIPIGEEKEDETPPERKPDEEDKKDPEYQELSPEEAEQAARYAAHYERHHPAFKYMCAQHQKYMAEAGPTNGALPQDTPAEPDKGDDKRKPEETPARKREDEEAEKMQRQDREQLVRMSRELAQTRGELLGEKVRKHMTALKQDYQIGEKAEARLTSDYMRTEPERWGSIDEIVTENYQRKGPDADPARDPFFYGAPQDYDAERPSDGSILEQYDHNRDFSTAERYLREKGYRADNPEQWDEAMAHAVTKRKEKERRG